MKFNLIQQTLGLNSHLTTHFVIFLLYFESFRLTMDLLVGFVTSHKI